MMRYLLFASKRYGADGGLFDFYMECDSIEQVKEECIKKYNKGSCFEFIFTFLDLETGKKYGEKLDDEGYLHSKGGKISDIEFEEICFN